MEAFPDNFNLEALRAGNLSDVRASIVRKVQAKLASEHRSVTIEVGGLVSVRDNIQLLGELLERFPGHVARMQTYHSGDQFCERWVGCISSADISSDYIILFDDNEAEIYMKRAREQRERQ